MTTMTKASKATRNSRQTSFLTHGGDDFDHRASNNARRMMDTAAINEQLDTETAESTINPNTGTTFRLVLHTQVYENYGAHDWDGNGECPQHWKAKGGCEYHQPIGDANAVLALGERGIARLVKEMGSQAAKYDDYTDEYVIGYSVVPNTEKTEEEADLDEMLGWLIDEELHALRMEQLHKPTLS